jgi:hypothetical protein
MAVRPIQVRRRTVLVTSLAGAAIFLASLGVSPWSFNPMTTDRELLISGQADDYWKRIKVSLGPTIKLSRSSTRKWRTITRCKFLFAAGRLQLSVVVSGSLTSGYAPAGLAALHGTANAPYHWGGIFSPEVGARLMAQNPKSKRCDWFR